jgi:hypothetical protein
MPMKATTIMRVAAAVAVKVGAVVEMMTTMSGMTAGSRRTRSSGCWPC